MRRSLAVAMTGALVGILASVAIAVGQSEPAPTEIQGSAAAPLTVPDGATPYMAPGASKMGMKKGDKIYYDGGATIVLTAVAYAWECSVGYFCLFDLDNGLGDRGIWVSTGSYHLLDTYGWNNRANSWRNRKTTGTYIDENTNGATGWRICANPGNANIPVGSKNEASAIFIRNSGYC